jgi:peroxiredoxin
MSLKRWYISLATAAPLVAVGALTATHRLQLTLAWIGASLSLLAVPAAIGRYYVLPTARTTPRMPLLLGAAGLGLVLALVASFRGEPAGVAVALALVGLASALAYVFWYSPLERVPGSALQVDAALPPFDVATVDGAAIDARTLCDRPTVWIFFRGNWCPLCTAQIREAVRAYQSIESLGARVALVSPQPQRHTADLARRLRVRFEFLIDPQGRAAKALGIAHRGALPVGFEVLGYEADAVLPTVIVTDRAGVVRYLHETDSYRIRPAPEVWLQVLARIAEIQPPRPSSPPG